MRIYWSEWLNFTGYVHKHKAILFQKEVFSCGQGDKMGKNHHRDNRVLEYMLLINPVLDAWLKFYWWKDVFYKYLKYSMNVEKKMQINLLPAQRYHPHHFGKVYATSFSSHSATSPWNAVLCVCKFLKII